MTLRELRMSRLMSQEVLAQRVGVTQGTVGTWERGERRPQINVMGKLAEVFGLPPAQITAIIDETMIKRQSD